MSHIILRLSDDESLVIHLRDVLLTLGLGSLSALIAYQTNVPPAYFMAMLMLIITALSLISTMSMKVADLRLTPRELKVNRLTPLKLHIRIQYTYPRLLRGLPEPTVTIIQLAPDVEVLDTHTEGIRSNVVEISSNVSLLRVKHYEEVELRILINSPLGGFSKMLSRHVKVSWLALPRVLRIAALNQIALMRRRQRYWRKGNRGDELTGIREYREGDRVKDISWRHTAKLGALMVGIWQRPEDEVSIIPLEPTNNLLRDHVLEVALSLAARLRDEEVSFRVLLQDVELKSFDDLPQSLSSEKLISPDNLPPLRSDSIIIASEEDVINLKENLSATLIALRRAGKEIPEVSLRG